MLKVCSAVVAILDFQSTNKKRTGSCKEQYYYKIIKSHKIMLFLRGFSQSESIISPRSHIEFPNLTKKITPFGEPSITISAE